MPARKIQGSGSCCWLDILRHRILPLFGTGADQLYAGADRSSDTFVFTSKHDAGTTERTWDRIFQFDSGRDKIDLHSIDADPGRGDQDPFRQAVS